MQSCLQLHEGIVSCAAFVFPLIRIISKLIMVVVVSVISGMYWLCCYCVLLVMVALYGSCCYGFWCWYLLVMLFLLLAMLVLYGPCCLGFYVGIHRPCCFYKGSCWLYMGHVAMVRCVLHRPLSSSRSLGGKRCGVGVRHGERGEHAVSELVCREWRCR